MSSGIHKNKRLLAERIHQNRRKLWDWYLEHARLAPPPFYCSVDLRDSGHKIVPVDSNLYPAGFNNICPEDQRNAPATLRAQIEGLAARADSPVPRKVLILPESHTTNVYYAENLHYLKQIILDAGFEVEVGWYGAGPGTTPEPIVLRSETGKEFSALPVRIENGILLASLNSGNSGNSGKSGKSGDFTPDIILLNNDFSSGYPKPLDEVKQPIFPSHRLGWHSRKKTEHFRHYNRLAAEFAALLGIDPWMIQIDTEEVGPVNFGEDQGIEEVAAVVDAMMGRITQAYETRKIAKKPFVFVKNNAGTYGMGIMVVHSGDELRTMNRRTKNKMSVGKNKLPIGSVAVQEGVPTSTLVDRLAAEPVIYLFGTELIGGFLRTNTEKGDEDNLNSQGMVFRKLCMSDLRKPEEIATGGAEGETALAEGETPEPILELVYGSIARISALATGQELASAKKN